MPIAAPWKNIALLLVRPGSRAYGGVSSDDPGPIHLRIWRRVKITVAAQCRSDAGPIEARDQNVVERRIE
jgi:hypothetical protein